MSITRFFLSRRDIPLKADSTHVDMVSESDLDFRKAGRKAAAACYEQGKSFKVTMVPEPDGMDWQGRKADYHATVETEVGSTRQIHDWRGLGVVSGALYEAVLPQWFWAHQARAKEPMDLDQALDLAESIAQHRALMRTVLDVLWTASTGTSSIDAQTIQRAAQNWRQGGLWLCYDDSGMYAWDQHTLADGAWDHPPLDHRAYPSFAILTGTFRNRNASAPHEPCYLKDCLETIASMTTCCAAEEHMVGDAIAHLEALRDSPPEHLSAFLRTAQMALGQWQDTDNTEHSEAQTPTGETP